MTWIETCRVIHLSRWTSPLCHNTMRYWEDELKRAKIKLLSRICYLCCLPLPKLWVLQGLRTPDSCMDGSLLLHQWWQPLRTWTYQAEKYFMEVLEWVQRATRMIILLTLSGVSPIPNRKPFIYPFPIIRPHLKKEKTPSGYRRLPRVWQYGLLPFLKLLFLSQQPDCVDHSRRFST